MSKFNINGNKLFIFTNERFFVINWKEEEILLSNGKVYYSAVGGIPSGKTFEGNVTKLLIS